MKLIAAVILALASSAFGQSAQYVDQIDKPTPISDKAHYASLEKVKAADQKQLADRQTKAWYSERFALYNPPIIRSTNYAAISAHDRKQRSR